jgi:hypothetical protein
MPNTYSASGFYLLFLENNSQSIFLCILKCYLIHIVFKSDQFFFFFGGPQSLMLARQAFYHLSYSARPFLSFLFSCLFLPFPLLVTSYY